MTYYTITISTINKKNKYKVIVFQSVFVSTCLITVIDEADDRFSLARACSDHLSGTSGGKQKIFPVNDDYAKKLGYVLALRSLLMHSKDTGAEQGKSMEFHYIKPESTTLSGLPVSTVSTSFLVSDYFKNRPSKLTLQTYVEC
ncbi:hypothetical protein Bca52824_033807 [Brassica carinata]|uniref:Uncharacterized protein n=1 Tax=Brassica carinata TaxID=52824 RepID=A0A8X7SEV5_BRACI|nr:hypothetical protein Bca52824_033807 [Brassica carinata]